MFRAFLIRTTNSSLSSSKAVWIFWIWQKRRWKIFKARLAVIGPFQSKTQMREGLAQTIQRIARKGAAVVWIQPPSEPKDQIKPSFYVVPEGKGAVVVVQSDLVAESVRKSQVRNST